MRHALPLALAASLCLAEPSVAEVRVLGTEFDPATYTVGQVVTAIVTWDDSGKSWIPERVATSLPDGGADGPTVLSAETRSKGGRPMLVVTFIAWKPGPGTLPSMYLGGQGFPPIPIDTVSVLPAMGRALPESLAQLEPSGLKTRMYLLGGGALLCALTAAFIVFRVMPWLRRLLARWAFLRARREFESVLEYLRGSSGNADAWAVLGTALKRYLGNRSDVDFLPLTPREIAGLPARAIPGSAGSDAAAILSAGEFVRFGGVTDGDLPAALDLAGALVLRIEDAIASPGTVEEGAKA